MDVLRMDDESAADTRDNLLMFGGAALMLLGAGMILSNPTVRRYLGGLNVTGMLQAAAPDLQRYLKLKAM